MVAALHKLYIVKTPKRKKRNHHCFPISNYCRTLQVNSKLYTWLVMIAAYDGGFYHLQNTGSFTLLVVQLCPVASLMRLLKQMSWGVVLTTAAPSVFCIWQHSCICMILIPVTTADVGPSVYLHDKETHTVFSRLWGRLWLISRVSLRLPQSWPTAEW